MFRNPILAIAFLHLCAPLFAQDARDIVRRADERARGKTSTADITVQTVRPTWTREMHLKTWSKGNDLALVLVTEPVKEKGVVYLKRDKEVWNWVPSIERTIKLSPSMMSQSWMGTDFTNDDLVKEASIVEDYDHAFDGETVIDGRACHIIRLTPKPAAAVVWGKVVLSIDKKDLLMLRAAYYDEDGALVNTLEASDVKLLGGRLLPARLEMTPAGKKGQKTVMIYNALTFDKPIDDAFFTTRNMTTVK